MPITKQRITLAVSKQDIKELEKLRKHLGETNSGVIKQSVRALYLRYFGYGEEDKK